MSEYTILENPSLKIREEAIELAIPLRSFKFQRPPKQRKGHVIFGVASPFEYLRDLPHGLFYILNAPMSLGKSAAIYTLEVCQNTGAKKSLARELWWWRKPSVTSTDSEEPLILSLNFSPSSKLTPWLDNPFRLQMEIRKRLQTAVQTAVKDLLREIHAGEDVGFDESVLKDSGLHPLSYLMVRLDSSRPVRVTNL